MIDQLGADFLEFSWYSALNALYCLAIETEATSEDTLFREIANLVEAGFDGPDEQLSTATVTELLEPLLYPDARRGARRYEQFLGRKGREYVRTYRVTARPERQDPMES